MKPTAAGLVLLIAGVAALPAAAQTTGPGPYYATPAWDQKLRCDAEATCPRFIVLSNWNNEAVLDRETGLVWERSPASTTHTWAGARIECTQRTVGGRMGWRLPSIFELASLPDPSVPSPDPFGTTTLPPGHPFTVTAFDFYWSATGFALVPSRAWSFSFGVPLDRTTDNRLQAWCVRGGMNADAYTACTLAVVTSGLGHCAIVVPRSKVKSLVPNGPRLLRLDGEASGPGGSRREGRGVALRRRPVALVGQGEDPA
jgi:hypothetical protein